MKVSSGDQMGGVFEHSPDLSYLLTNRTNWNQLEGVRVREKIYGKKFASHPFCPNQPDGFSWLMVVEPVAVCWPVHLE